MARSCLARNLTWLFDESGEMPRIAAPAAAKALGLAVEVDRFRGAPRRVVLGIKIEHHGLAGEARQRDRLSVLVGQGEIRGGCPFHELMNHIAFLSTKKQDIRAGGFLLRHGGPRSRAGIVSVESHFQTVEDRFRLAEQKDTDAAGRSEETFRGGSVRRWGRRGAERKAPLSRRLAFSCVRDVPRPDRAPGDRLRRPGDPSETGADRGRRNRPADRERPARQIRQRPAVRHWSDDVRRTRILAGARHRSSGDFRRGWPAHPDRAQSGNLDRHVRLDVRQGRAETS